MVIMPYGADTDIITGQHNRGNSNDNNMPMLLEGGINDAANCGWISQSEFRLALIGGIDVAECLLYSWTDAFGHLAMS